MEIDGTAVWGKNGLAGRRVPGQLKTPIAVGSQQRRSLARDLNILREVVCLDFVLCGSKQGPETRERKERLAG